MSLKLRGLDAIAAFRFINDMTRQEYVFQGAAMVDEGEVRKGKTGGLVVCYRGAWLPQVIVDVVHSSCLKTAPTYCTFPVSKTSS